MDRRSDVLGVGGYRPSADQNRRVAIEIRHADPEQPLAGVAPRWPPSKPIK
jgi:hypothetical protein